MLRENGHSDPNCPKDSLERIPGVGPRIARHLRALNITSVEDLVGRDPDQMYEELGRLRQTKPDRCLLYVFRCAVYFAGRQRHDPELLKWWNWADKD